MIGADTLLDLQVADAMQRASRALCDLKYQLDMSSREPLLQEFQNDWMGAYNICAFFGSDFLSTVVPFLEYAEQPQLERFEAMVDCRQVLGASIKGKPRSIPPEKVQGRIDDYSRHHCDGLTRADYTWYQQLGLLVAHEGKHRVAFMRHHGDLPIAARVTPMAYPAADRLKLVKLSRRYWRVVAILDDRYLQVVERPDTTSWYLGAYGVKTYHWGQLEGLPSLDLVCAAIAQKKWGTLDLQELQAFEQEVGEQQAGRAATALEIQGYDFDWRRWFVWPSVACVAGGLATAVYEATQWLPALVVSAGSLSGAFGLMLGLSLMRWRQKPERNVLAAWYRRGPSGMRRGIL